MSAPGYVYLVGAGPWDPGLLTLRGRELLERADVVVYDYLANPEHLQHVRPEAERVPARGSEGRIDQDALSALLVARARAGKVVVRLKGGDPFVFGRGGEEAEALAAAGVPFEVVPGVTAAAAAAAFAGIPLTHRGFGSTLALVSGHQSGDAPEADHDWRALAQMSTLVFYMAARRLAEIAAALVGAGRDPATPVALVQWATRPDQRTVVTTLAGCARDAEPLTPPLTVVVGEVVGLRDRIGWYEQRPLFGTSVVVTRSRGQQDGMAARLHELGAEVVPLPTIAFEAGDPVALDAAVGALGTYDWVLFTSANGVDYFVDALHARGLDLRAFRSARVGCIGPATARRLARRGIVPDVVPEEYVAEGLLEALLAEGVGGRRFLVPRASVAREILPDTLRAEGATVDVLPVYRTVPPEVDPEVRDRVARGAVDVVSFTSSSTVTHLCGLFDADELAVVQARVKAVCIGPITARTAREAGFEVAAVAAVYTMPGLVDALVRWRSG